MFAVVAAVLAAIAIAVLAIADVRFNAGPFASTGSSAEVSAPAAVDMPMPEGLKGYLKSEAPTTGHVNQGLR